MRRIFRWSGYTLIGFLALFFVGMFMIIAFAEASAVYSIGLGLATAVFLTTPFVLLLLIISAIGLRLQGRAAEKRKNEAMAGLRPDSARLRGILNRLSDDDRAYLEQHLGTPQIGLSDEGEMVSLDELMADDDDESQSLYVG